jgi:hypothetical protein
MTYLANRRALRAERSMRAQEGGQVVKWLRDGTMLVAALGAFTSTTGCIFQPESQVAQSAPYPDRHGRTQRQRRDRGQPKVEMQSSAEAIDLTGDARRKARRLDPDQIAGESVTFSGLESYFVAIETLRKSENVSNSRGRWARGEGLPRIRPRVEQREAV